MDARGRVPLLKYERDEWELPGGPLEAADPSPESTVHLGERGCPGRLRRRDHTSHSKIISL
ncbi:hypothetical protein [Streptomyces sp. NPDC058155]|uniref:hypothetical protein n=1 Tax=Streptomyces sp. NPDC058155 TaxID=3346359 RepID=UPI0036EA3164